MTLNEVHVIVLTSENSLKVVKVVNSWKVKI